MNRLASTMISPEEYLTARVIADEAGKELLSRLDLMTIKPRVIIDAGCATGEESRRLQAKYPQASVIAVDHNAAMLSFCHRPLQTLQANAEQLPLKANSVDMLFANLFLPWQVNHAAVLKEWRRVMKEEGLVLFSALGPDTLKDYHAMFGDLLPHLQDMHDIGDLLLQCGFSDPVVDVSYITLCYQDPNKFIAELKASGMIAHNIDVIPNGPIQANFEIIYGHAFAAAATNQAADGVAYFPLSKLRRKSIS